ncbi:MAG: 7-carboxy-7-deazaguanine synthase QueE [Armatimonadota bacterium]|jgi:7-carboxy-7-deazaguanine synthase
MTPEDGPATDEMDEARDDYRAAREAIEARQREEERIAAEADTSLRAPLHEIFTSIQGEALFAGLQQIFIRFCGCDLACPWCDTPEARAEPPAEVWCQARPGVRGFTIDNPARIDEVVRVVRRILKYDEEGAIHSIALTGGEPLLHAEYVSALAAMLRPLELPIMLETNGQRPGDLQTVLGMIDWVAADYKLDSAMGRPLDDEARREFLRLAQYKRAFVKIVVTDEATEEELEEVYAQIAAVDPACPVFIQPVTATGGARPPGGLDLIRFRAIAMKRLRDVRVMPQIHKLLGLK